jgi:hypothetical protein
MMWAIAFIAVIVLIPVALAVAGMEFIEWMADDYNPED